MATAPDRQALLAELNHRSREVFRRVVEGYLASGDPVGSRTLTRTMSERISAATIRNVMQDLEYLGLLDSPHVSAGRIPTELGLRLFVDALMEIGTVSPEDRERIDAVAGSNAADVTELLDQVGVTLSGITQGASLVLTPKQDTAIRHVEFVGLGPDRALAVLVFADGHVENRLFTPPPGVTPSAMREAANLLNALGEGRTLAELRQIVARDIAERRREIDALAQELVEAGIALWHDRDGPGERLIVRGSANLLGREGTADLDRIRSLFDDLERKREIAEVIDLTEQGEGVRIFIGSENKLFSLTGSSVVVAPYIDGQGRIVGAIGVIGPTRLNYGRIVPIVNYTAQLVSRLVSDRGKG
jgi:heat-inducible transcriptional repressor